MSIYDTYCATGHAWDASPEYLRTAHQWYRRQFGSVIPQNRDIRVVDLGCGPGYFVSWLVSSGYRNVIGVDGSPVLLAMAKERGLPTVQDDILNYLEVNTGGVDVISLFHVLEHFSLDEAHHLMRLINRNLNKGGLCLVAVPNVMAPFPVNAYGDISHRLYFSWLSLRQLLVSAGFTKVDYLSPYEVVGRSLRSRLRHGLTRTYLMGCRVVDGLVNGFSDMNQRPLDRQLIAVCRQGDAGVFDSLRI